MPRSTVRDNAKQGGGGFKPNPHQELLLRAALMSGNQALDAWHNWRSRLNPDKIDEGSLRMLPLLYSNMRKHGVQDPFLKTCKEIYQVTWYANETLFYHLRSLLENLDRAHIEAMLLKGVPLALSYYPDPGLRPMEDFDLLVRKRQARQAVEMFVKLGWEPDVQPARELGESFFDIFRALHFSGDIMHNLDLHWQALYSLRTYDLSDGFWEGVSEIDLNGLSVRVPNDTDMLLHTCHHGMRWAPVPPFRWVADAMFIMSKGRQAIDWDRIVYLVTQCDLVLPLYQALTYLHEAFNADVPLEVMTKLGSLRIPENSRKVYESSLQARSEMTPAQVFKEHLVLFSAGTMHLSWMQRIYKFPFFLQMYWRLSHLWQVPFIGFIKIIRRMKQYLVAGGSRVFGKRTFPNREGSM